VAVALTSGYARAFLVASVAVLAGGLLGLIIPPPVPPAATGDRPTLLPTCQQAVLEG
jgi:hypothetical protein